MEKLNANINSIRPAAPDLRPQGPRPGSPAAAEFRNQLQALQQTMPTAGTIANQAPSALKFSNHAVDRMQSRGIRFSPEEMGKIEGAIAKAAGKGSKESLLITDKAALIVSVKDNTVVTVMDKASLKENVFTNIDSAVMI